VQIIVILQEKKAMQKLGPAAESEYFNLSSDDLRRLSSTALWVVNS